MALSLRCLVTFLALSALAPIRAAEDDAQATSDVQDADGSPDSGDEAGDTGADLKVEEDDTAKAKQIMSSAEELQEKLGQLNALLEMKGDSVDPALKERLDGLKKQLAGLGLGDTASTWTNSKDAQELYGQCIVLSMKRMGMRRPATLNGVAKLADPKTTKEAASTNDFIRMVATCLTDIEVEELNDAKKGRLAQLPKKMATKAASSEGRQAVLSLENEMWSSLQEVAAAFNKENKGDQDPANAPPVKMGLAAMVVFFAIVGVLGKKFMDMQNKSTEKKEKKKDKKAK